MHEAKKSARQKIFSTRESNPALPRCSEVIAYVTEKRIS
jgi:hypothetical protein